MISYDPDTVPLSYCIAAIILLIVLNGIISLCYGAMEAVSRSRVRQMAEDDPTDRKANRLYHLILHSSRYRYTNKILNYCLVCAGLMLSMTLPYNPWVCAAVFLALTVCFGEIFTRKLAIQHSESLALGLSGLQYVLCLILYPVTFILLHLANLFLRLFRQRTDVSEQEFSEDEVMSLLEVGQQSGVLGEEGKKMIGSIFQFDDELAYEIMTPRTDVFMIDINDPPEEYIDELMELRYTRMPVCEDDTDNIIGILHIKDYLIRARETGFDKVDIKEILRTPYFVPETKKIDTLFFELQKEKQHIAILIDEYGGFSGIVTMEDIIEEIVGDIDDEYDEDSEVIEKIDEGLYLVDGNVNLYDLNEELNIDLESDHSETIGGYLIDLMGEIPSDGTVNQSIETEKYTFTIVSVHERRIEKVRLFIHPDNENRGNPDDDEREEHHE